MRRLAAAALAAVALAAAAETQLRPWEGREAPALVRNDLDGKSVSLEQYRGRVVLVNFWATWCDPCREEMPSIERLRAKMAGRPFEVLTVNYGEAPERVAEFLKRQRLSLPVLLDTDKKAADEWKAGGLPMTFLVDAKGHIRYSAFGECDWSAGEPLRIVEALVAEVPRAR